MKSQNIFHRGRLRLHRNRAAQGIMQHDFLIDFSTNDIFERISSLNLKPQSILEIGARTGHLSAMLLEYYKNCDIIATDLSESMLHLNAVKNKVVLDEEDLSIEGSFDLIVSVLNLHNINDIAKFFAGASKLLTQNGILIASLFGAGSLKSLREFFVQSEIAAGIGSAPHVHPFATASDIYRLLQLAGFKFVVTDAQKIDLEYDTAIACMRDLRGMGESSLLYDTRPISRKTLSTMKHGSFIDVVEVITLTASCDPRPV